MISPGWEINDIGIRYLAGSSENVFWDSVAGAPGRFKGWGYENSRLQFLLTPPFWQGIQTFLYSGAKIVFVFIKNF